MWAACCCGTSQCGSLRQDLGRGAERVRRGAQAAEECLEKANDLGGLLLLHTAVRPARLRQVKG